MSHDNLHHKALFRARQAVRWLNTRENARRADFPRRSVILFLRVAPSPSIFRARQTIWKDDLTLSCSVLLENRQVSEAFGTTRGMKRPGGSCAQFTTRGNAGRGRVMRREISNLAPKASETYHFLRVRLLRRCIAAHGSVSCKAHNEPLPARPMFQI